MRILYCESCRMRVSDEEIQSGAALVTGEHQVLCSNCAPARLPDGRRKTSPQLRRPRGEQPAGSSAQSSRREHIDYAGQKSSPKAGSWIAVHGILLVVAIAFAVFAVLKSSRNETPAPQSAGSSGTLSAAQPEKIPGKPAAPTTHAPATAIADGAWRAPATAAPAEAPNGAQANVRSAEMEIESIRDGAAQRRLDDAKKYFAAHPRHPSRYAKLLQEILATYKSTPAGREAEQILSHLKIPEPQLGPLKTLDLRPVANVVTTAGMFFSKDNEVERLVFSDWSPKTFEGVRFDLVDPQGASVPNAIMLHGPNGMIPPTMPKSVSLRCGMEAQAIHFLSGVSGWGASGPNPDGTVSMIVRLRYADGKSEEHPLKDGVHFADYIRVIDVPESQLAFRLRDQQIRYLSIVPQRPNRIDEIELVKGPDHTAPIVMAVTVEGFE